MYNIVLNEDQRNLIAVALATYLLERPQLPKDGEVELLDKLNDLPAAEARAQQDYAMAPGRTIHSFTS